MLSAVIPSTRSYPAMPLAGQLVHHRCVYSGPLVLGATTLNFPTLVEDRDQTVSRRFEPNSRAILIGEQPNPWELLHPQDMTSRHRGAKRCRRYELLDTISLLSPRYLLFVVDGRSMQHHQFTMTNFRFCSACQPRSQASLCHYTLLDWFPSSSSLPLRASVTL